MSWRDSSRNRPAWPYLVGAAIGALAIGGVLVVRDLGAYGRSAPEFPALAEAPDLSVHGTVAYYVVVADPKTQPTGGCVRVTSAAGAPSRDVLCFEAGGDDTGPQLGFLPDGRLEVTMFSWPPDQALVAVWQRIVDIRSGDIEEVPPNRLPATPTALSTASSEAGERVEASVRSNTAELRIVAADGTARILWAADVSPDYGIEVLWVPGGEWILANDGRLLRVTVGDGVDIRVLAEEPTGVGGFGSTDPPIVTFAVTSEDLLADGG